MNYTPDQIQIFVVEDDPFYAKLITYTAELNPDHVVHVFENGKDCLAHIHLKPTLVLLDYSLPDITGEEVLRSIKTYDSGIEVIIISSQESINTAISLLKHGAYDYITKDDETKDRLLNSINHVKKLSSMSHEIQQLKEKVIEKYDFNDDMIGQSVAIQKVFALMQKAIHTNITVSICGETGTGKELVAKAIHYKSTRKNKPFIAVNIAAIPENLIESELFGHEKGAFTGALARRKGKFEEANGGTLFLDEIGEMDISLQAKLLRVLQERELTRLGGNELINFDVRVIVATHKDLAEEVKSDHFREDLYYRLLGIPIMLPPLRDRGKDIIMIAKHLLRSFCQENRMQELILSREAQDKLLSYPFPGNVRELKSVIELAAVMTDDDQIKVSDLSFQRLNREDQFIFEEMSLKDYDFRIIRHFLNKYDNDIMLVAKKLDIGKSSIYRYLKEMEERNI